MAPILSPREGQILGQVAAGLTSKAIAARLGIGESTVNWHLANALRKLGAASRAEAVAIAMRDGLFAAAQMAAPVRPSFARERRRWQVLLAASAAAVLATPVLVAAAIFAPSPSFAPTDGAPGRVPPTRMATEPPSAAPLASPTPVPVMTSLPAPTWSARAVPTPALATPALATPALQDIRVPLPTIPRLP